MKNLALTIVIMLAFATASLAQCGKTSVLTSSTTDHVDATGKLVQSIKEKVVIEISKTSIDVSVNDIHKINASIKTNTCAWSKPYKTGKTVIHGVMKMDGKEDNVTCIITGKNGKISFSFEMQSNPNDQVKITADTFAAKG